MIEHAVSTLPRSAKGPLASAPRLAGAVQNVVDTEAAWPEVQATTHWHFSDQTRIDGVDLYVGDEELGHLHLAGSIHLATTPSQREQLLSEGLRTRSPFARGWTQSSVSRLGVAGAVGLIRRNHDRLRPKAEGSV